ncbi:MAG: T9SS type A sorting domain-containing protein [Bacteroidota bacterium]
MKNRILLFLLVCGFATSSVAQVDGGTLSGGPFDFCVGNGGEDMIAEGDIDLSGEMGSNFQWVITDDMGNILGLPGNYDEVNFDGAGSGTCLVWHLAYEDGLQGLEAGNNANTDLMGTFDLSNPISVERNEQNGGSLDGGPFSFCVGDGQGDFLSPDGLFLSGNAGTNSQWVVTDDQGEILGLPASFTDVDFDTAPPGTCLVWHLSYDDGLIGLEVGNNASTDLVGCFGLSNPAEVQRFGPNGGVLTGGPFEFCVGDGEADNIPLGEITLTESEGPLFQWVVTDEQGFILGLPPSYEDVDFDGAGEGTCLVWHLSFAEGLIGAEVGNNANSDLFGCFSLSNPVEVIRNANNGGVLEGGSYQFCVGDGIPDNLLPGSIDLSEESGENSQWVVTDPSGMILGLPGNFTDVNFDGAGEGNCFVWHLSYSDGLEGLEAGNMVADLVGCFHLSNPVEIIRLDGTDPDCVTGINDLTDFSNQIEIFPNPTKDRVLVDFNQIDGFDLNNMVLFNLAGQKENIPMVVEQNTMVSVDLSSLSNGLYFLNIQTEDFRINKKIFKVD